MCSTKNFRVTLNLSHYYNDHRHRARIFVSGNMNTVEELKVRIGAIFNISNFYLTSSLNEYLPPSEDVRILQNDETVWVIPHKADQSCNGTLLNLQNGEATNETVNGIISQIKSKDNILQRTTIETCDNSESLKNVHKKKKRKHDKLEDARESSQHGMKDSPEPNQSPVVISNVKKKKFSMEDSIVSEDATHKKKKKNNSLNVTNVSVKQDLEQSTVDDSMYMEQEESVPKKKKEKQLKSTDVKVTRESENGKSQRVDLELKKSEAKNPCDFLDSLFESSPKQTSSNPPKANLKRDSNNANTSILCKGNLSNYKQKVNVQSNTEEYLREKKINIVKIEILGRGKDRKDLVDSGKNKIEFGNSVSEQQQQQSGSGLSHAVISDKENKISLIKNTTPIESEPVLCETDNIISGYLPVYNEKELIVKDIGGNIHNDATECHEIKYTVSDDNKNENQVSCPKIISHNDKKFKFGCLETIDHKGKSTSSDNSINMSPITRENISSSSWNWCTLSSVEPKPADTSIISGLQSFDCSSDHLKRKMVSGLGDILQRLRDNGSTVSSRSSSIIGLDEDASKQIDVKSICYDYNIVSNVTTRSKRRSASLSKLDSDNTDIDDDHNSSVSQKRRKRVRRRKKKSDNTPLNDLPSIPINMPVLKPFEAKTNPCTHIKFIENVEDSSLMIVDVSKNKQKSLLDTQTITIESDTEEIDIKIENILKSPLMDGILPKSGDIISFKILTMSENYNPELSPYITAKVKGFINETKMTTLEIVNGLAHFETPAGKLCMDMNEDKILNNIRELSWTDMIQPRLLFP